MCSLWKAPTPANTSAELQPQEGDSQIIGNVLEAPTCYLEQAEMCE